MVAHEEYPDPQGGEGLEHEDGGGFLVLSLDQLQGVHNKGLHAVDRRSETENLPGKTHGCQQAISLADGAGELVVEMGLSIDPQLVDGGQVLREVLYQTAELGGKERTFSRQGVCLRKVMREVTTFSNDVIKRDRLYPQ